MRIASWNILHGQPLSPPELGQPEQPVQPEQPAQLEQREHLSQIAQFLVNSEIELIGLQEIDAFQSRSGEHLQIDELTKDLEALSGVKYFSKYARTVVGTPGFSWRKLKRDEAEMDFKDEQPSYGIGLISKSPVKSWHTLQLGRSLIGLPLAVPAEGKNGKPRMRFIYVKDEPRIALAAELASGLTVVVTHLSFVPLVNLYQLWRVKRWLRKFPGKHILMGDLNLPFNLPVSKRWRSLNEAKSYPSWGAKVKFDYLLADFDCTAMPIELPASGYSDHLPIVADLKI